MSRPQQSVLWMEDDNDDERSAACSSCPEYSLTVIPSPKDDDPQDEDGVSYSGFLEGNEDETTALIVSPPSPDGSCTADSNPQEALKTGYTLWDTVIILGGCPPLSKWTKKTSHGVFLVLLLFLLTQLCLTLKLELPGYQQPAELHRLHNNKHGKLNIESRLLQKTSEFRASQLGVYLPQSAPKLKATTVPPPPLPSVFSLGRVSDTIVSIVTTAAYWVSEQILSLCRGVLRIPDRSKNDPLALGVYDLGEFEADDELAADEENQETELSFFVKAEKDSIPANLTENYPDLPTNQTAEGNRTGNGKMQCIMTTTVPSTPICIFDPADDKYVSAQLASEGHWEPQIIALFKEALANFRLKTTATALPQNPEYISEEYDGDGSSLPEPPTTHQPALVIDVGANIGVYTLLAAALGHPVLAIEPMYDSIVRLKKAAQLANVTRLVKLVPKAVTDVRGQFVAFSYKEGNKGGTSVRPISPAEAKKIRKVDKHGVVETVTLNDLVDLINASTAVIKMDIEGYECKALTSSRQLLESVFVPYIFMEWGTMFRNRHRYYSPCHASDVRQSAAMLSSLSYVPFLVKNGARLDPKRSDTDWRLGDIYWRHESAPKLHVER